MALARFFFAAKLLRSEAGRWLRRDEVLVSTFGSIFETSLSSLLDNKRAAFIVEFEQMLVLVVWSSWWRISRVVIMFMEGYKAIVKRCECNHLDLIPEDIQAPKLVLK